MERLSLTAYDDKQDRSPLICGGGAVVLGVMAWREFFAGGGMGARIWGMLLAIGILTTAAVALLWRRRIRIELVDNSEGEGHLEIHRPGSLGQVIPESRVGYVKLEEGRMTIHYYEGQDLKRTSFPIRGAGKKGVAEMMGILGKWQS